MQETLRDLGSIPGLGRFLGGVPGNPPYYSCLENPMDRGAPWAIVHGLQRVKYDCSDSMHTVFAMFMRNLKSS